MSLGYLFPCLVVAGWFYSTGAIAQVDPTVCVENPRCEFHFPFSDRVYLTASQLNGLSKDTLWEARNEIMARRGYAFDTPRAHEYFGRKAFYRPKTKNITLNGVEKANAQLIQSFEAFAPHHTTRPSRAFLNQYARVSALRGPDGFLSVRDGPGIQFTEQDRLPSHAPLRVELITGGWAQVSYDSGGGWVSMNFLVPSQQTDSQSAETPSLPQIPQRTEQLARHDENRSVRPQTDSLKPGARSASERYPRTQFYTPGTSDVGQMWAEPRVSEEGELRFDLHFLDPTSEIDKKVYTLELEEPEIDLIIASLRKAEEWAEIAQTARVRDHAKRLHCFPAEYCDESDGRSSSTELLFRTLQDGEASVLINRRLGRYTQSYGFTIQNGKKLAKALEKTRADAVEQYQAGTRTSDEVDALFR